MPATAARRARYQALTARGKKYAVVATAIARESAGWLWSPGSPWTPRTSTTTTTGTAQPGTQEP